MKIIKRLSDSISSPSRLSNAVNDKGITTFLYTLVLIFILIIPYIVSSFTIMDLTYDAKVQIRNLLFREEIEFRIENGVMTNYGSDEYYYKDDFISSLGLYISDTKEVVLEENKNTALVAFLSDGVYLTSEIMSQKILNYSDYDDLMNIDFNDVKEGKVSFWDPMFNVIQQKLDEFKPIYTAIYIFSSILQAIITICIYSLILVCFNRLGVKTHLRFSDHWKLCIYGLTGFVLGTTLSIMFNFTLLYYVGFIVSIVICSISSRKFIIRGGSNEL